MDRATKSIFAKSKETSKILFFWMRAFLFLFSIAIGAFGDSTAVWKWLDFSEAYPIAKKNGKHLIVNFYSFGCGWCRTMDQKTFGDTAIISALKKDFVGAKVNTGSNRKVIWREKEITERELSILFLVRGTPNTAFIDSAGNLVASLPGYLPPEKFITVLKYVSGYWYKELTFPEFLASEEALKRQEQGK